ncbi:hypothetical protein [Umezawaea tangerina]|uniref:hypothetical protein n=1 Tax=Umezawaea tangerina TaxID=84725 RepID=UPI001474CDB3|nr:hypothetical protein [Umezawaea tangerina]
MRNRRRDLALPRGHRHLAAPVVGDSSFRANPVPGTGFGRNWVLGARVVQA